MHGPITEKENAIYERFFQNSLLYYEFVPIRFLRSRDTNYMSINWIIVLVTVILLLCSIIPIVITSRSKKNELN